MSTDSAHGAPDGTAPLVAELERHLLARQALLARLGGASESVRREALAASDKALRTLLDRLGALWPPAGTATRADEAA